VCSCLIFGSWVHGKSVYAISRHTTSTIKAFQITDDGLLETQYTGFLPNNGSGAIDLAVSDRDNILFASYDGANIIEAISTKTMERVTTLTISGGIENEIAGLEYCRTYNLLLAAERYDTKIRILEFDPLEGGFTRNIELPMPNINSGGILGLCLDETEMRLYISQSEDSRKVNYYDFSVEEDQIYVVYRGSIPIEWNGESKIAVGIALYNDKAGTKYLYSAGYNHENPNQNPYLIRTTLSPSNEVIDSLGVAVDPYTYVAGVDADDRTGYLYLTTLGANSSIRVYDPNAWSDDPNECQYLQSITGFDIAGPAGIAIGPNLYEPDRLWIQKRQIDPPLDECASPGTLVTYRTTFHQGSVDETNVVLRESLPAASVFISADPNTGFYDEGAHTYYWYIGDLSALDPNSPIEDPNMYFDMTVYVTDTAEPGGYIVNVAEVESDNAYAKDRVNTSICCWTMNGVIYVDKEAAGHNSGVNWANAYRSLNDALIRADKGCGSEIWVAEGIYSPGNSPSDAFTVPENVQIYGGFRGTETFRSQRNWKRRQTVLTGYIDRDMHGNDVQNDTIVIMADNTCLDGFTIEGGRYHGVSGSNADFALSNCVLMDHNQQAVYSVNGNLTIQWCEIYNNGYKGIYYTGNGSTLEVTHTKIYGNGSDGIYAGNADVYISNSLIYRNGLIDKTGSSGYGINLQNPGEGTLLRNNTITYHANEGVRAAGQNIPAILNCIVWGNGGTQLAGFHADQAAFNSCIQDCNDVNFNIHADPAFAYADFEAGWNNFHLAFDSPCVDAGAENSVTDPNEFDIDGEIRVFGAAVDIGADEVVACAGPLTADDVFNPLDHNADGIINFADFSGFAKTWMSRDPNDPMIVTDPNSVEDPNYVDPGTMAHWRECWDPAWDLDDTLTSARRIDWADLELFWDRYWFWIACWKENEFLDRYIAP
jgi:hypothetical protein